MIGRGGFTLVELVAVLLILGLVAAVSVPTLGEQIVDDPLMQGSSLIVALLSEHRRRAMGQARPVDARFDTRHGKSSVATASGDSVGAWQMSALPLPAGVSLTEGQARFRFHPTGGAAGDTLYLRGGPHTATIWVDRWTGAAHVRR